MAGNTERRNKRNEGSKKGPSVGTGGHSRRALKGKGPTPPAEMRKGHAKQRAANAAAKRKAAAPAARRPAGGRPGRGGKSASELVAGRNSVLEVLRADAPATSLFIAQYIDSDDRVREAMKIANTRGIPLMEIPRPELDRMTDGAIHQGLVLQMPPYEYAHPDDLVVEAHDRAETPLVVALDSVTDPRNLGAVIRSAAAFGGHGVVVPERRAAGMTAGAWKSSAGAASRMPVARAANLTRALEAYKKAGLTVVGLAADGDITLDELAAATDPLVVVVGSEGKGLGRLVQETCDITVRIPMAGGNESLNAGVAASIVLYEVARRRGAK
ncbi:23S rRNA (guanosine(2251)-2'-O)-methyltransferase RlmB [Embleya scabrispora]|uniref:23S rRNA (Guanosine(2251)-2'-O)-methyltransferase RlmB n=1 Tax=Embleya scabrispora TaxID=159449 RepID=A0A1T3NXX5_9ACTN|nr:23S rRNA (guanosine(2251)-2'-O)-methyltransferase RlmB [Embleya scabrispora]OPC81697.1 23S rRNA (guanosine(2251)-2'-O)-methyltransferase RlmB [Embleya scabrispora]